MTPPADTTPTTSAPIGEGPRHLVVGLLLRPRSTTVTSVTLAPGNPPRLLAQGHPWVSVVARGDEVVHVSRLPEPFIHRSIRLNETGPHHIGAEDEGYAVVALPFATTTDLTRSRVFLFDTGGRPGLVSADELTGEFRARSQGGTGLRSVGYEQLTATRDWPQIGRMLGIDAPPGRFEIYRDRADRWRWRLRAAGGQIVAASSDSFTTRAEAEAEVTWLRRHTGSSPTTSLD